MFKEIIVQRILDYIKKITTWKRNPSRHCKGKTSYLITENMTLFPKQESSAPVSDHHTFMNSLLIEMIYTHSRLTTS
jgi:hypothetical protein